MNPIAMAVLLVVSLSALTYSLNRRLMLLKIGKPENRLDHPGQRLAFAIKYAFGQWKMPNYPLAGAAHILIFYGFLVLLAQSLRLWGRGFVPSFDLWILGPTPVALPVVGRVAIGHAYDLAKNLFEVLVLAGAGIFLFLRLVRKEKRMTLHAEGLIILGIIVAMMIADLSYDAAATVLQSKAVSYGCNAPSDTMAATCWMAGKIIAPWQSLPPQPLEVVWYAPVSSSIALLIGGLSPATLSIIAQVGFWVHATLVLLFANILPYTKHFHIITAIPNVLLADLAPPGRLRSLAPSAGALMEKVGEAAELNDINDAAIGVGRLEHFDWKSLLDLYTCTECGRCTDNCPANATGKTLSPKDLIVGLRDHLYAREEAYIDAPGSPLNPQVIAPASNGAEGENAAGTDGQEPEQRDDPQPRRRAPFKPMNLVPGVIAPEVLWACTSCRACEQFCPVMITHVGKITEMRRNLVLLRGEFPPELSKTFDALETNGNPWNLSRMDRAAWAEGLGVVTMAEKPDTEVLLWVGCAGSYDDRAKKIARSTVKLLQAAKVDFAILGEQENCTGDVARRAGNEYLFAQLAETNVSVLNGYCEQGGAKLIVAICPHCTNTLAHEYPDFGGHYRVVSHVEFLLGLVREKKLVPRGSHDAPVVLHDSCYLGRYNGVFDAPRDLLASIPGVKLTEPSHFTRQAATCCGAGGAQMFMEEQNKDRMNVRRVGQLLQTGATTIASACPFCMTMLTDGLKAVSKDEQVQQLDISELLERSCLHESTPAAAG